MHQCIIFYRSNTLHISDDLSVHHQEFQDCTYSNQTDNALCLLASTQQYLTYACCCMYGLELLMME